MPGLSSSCSRATRSELPARRRLAAGLAAALLAAAPPALADPPAEQEDEPQASGDQRPVRLQRPTAIRGTLAVYWEPEALLIGGATHDVGYGVTVARQVHDRIALELLLGGGGNAHRTGPHLGGGLRLSPIAWRKHAITVSLGAQAAFLRDYGPVGISHLEAGYELRLASGFNLVVSYGFGVVLNDSRSSQHCQDESIFFLCKESYRAGDAGVSLHVGVGGSF